MGVRRGTPTVVSGIRYRSGFEATVASDLVARGFDPHYEETRIAYTEPRIYVVDFSPRHDEGQPVLIEAKGYFDAEDRRKILTVRSAGHDVRMLFQNAKGKINRGSKTTNALWCDRHGIPWAEGLVPEEWIGR